MFISHLMLVSHLGEEESEIGKNQDREGVDPAKRVYASSCPPFKNIPAYIAFLNNCVKIGSIYLRKALGGSRAN